MYRDVDTYFLILFEGFGRARIWDEIFKNLRGFRKKPEESSRCRECRGIKKKLMKENCGKCFRNFSCLPLCVSYS